MELKNTLQTEHYNFELPDNRIRKYPIEKREEAKLLLYQQGAISHHQFYSLPDLLPNNSCLVFNDTKVIPARLHFKKETGALIEIFLLEPVAPSTIISEAMLVKNSITWKCMIGNLKKWKDAPLELNLEIDKKPIQVKAHLVDRSTMSVRLEWNGQHAFVDIVAAIGALPLPPYFHRDAEDSDYERYQTVYSAHEGAVAAPTAGLHFTTKLMEELGAKGIQKESLTLHVSAGTFQPVKAQNITEHKMHAEQVVLSLQNIHNLIKNSENLIAVGTTSMRTLESLYWYGVKLIQQESTTFFVDQNYAYSHSEASLPTLGESLRAILTHMEQNKIQTLNGSTEIFIRPGYKLRACRGLITNYHMPQSTLLMLIAAIIGPDWKTIYQEAMDHGYQFLSYGDSSLLLP